jgi:hypothetical protein
VLVEDQGRERAVLAQPEQWAAIPGKQCADGSRPGVGVGRVAAIGSFWLGRWGPPGDGDGGDDHPQEFQAKEDPLVEADGGMVVLVGAPSSK